ncbi:MAG: hypothetical protein RBS77_02390 [Candidatus Moranbacteria bacterium]|jgi:hypothetical protein|nr:hypothetical protein [Candidatus Moranbacteria bacterium]
MINKRYIFIMFLNVCFFVLPYFVLAVTCPTTGSWDSTSGVCIPSATGLPSPGGTDPATTVISNLMNWLLGIIGIIAIIAFVISGLQYLTAAGNQNAMEAGKRNMQWSIVGVIVALMGYIIIKAVDTLLKGTSSAF